MPLLVSAMEGTGVNSCNLTAKAGGLVRQTSLDASKAGMPVNLIFQ